MKPIVLIFCVITSKHELWAKKLESIGKISNISIVVCSVDPKVARTRIIDRGIDDPSRERFHGDNSMLGEKNGVQMPFSKYEPPSLSVPSLEVNCLNGYDPEIAKIVMSIEKGVKAHQRQSL